MKLLIILFIRIHYWLNSIGIRIKGLGFVQKFLKREYEFNSLGCKFFYYPPVEGSYNYLLIGKPNEPETHLFLSKIIPFVKALNFVDVGASIGEFVMTTSKYPNVQKVFAFEPRPECAFVLRKNIVINDDKKIIVFENAVSDKEGDIEFYLNTGGTTSGIFSSINAVKKLNIKAITLDSALPEELLNPIILIDVEGAEPLVIKGNLNFIRKNNPLIIFEYNYVSKQYYNLETIRSLLGTSYSLFRLKGDGNLDVDFSNSWNCIAVSQQSIYSKIIEPLIKS